MDSRTSDSQNHDHGRELSGSGFTTTTAVPLYWARYGSAGGDPLVVLHGGPGAGHEYLLPQLLNVGGADRDLLLYDQRGGGRSKTDDPTPITWRTHVDDLARVVGSFRIESLTLVGYSWGGLLALLYAIEASTRSDLPSPRRLVLIDPAPVTRPLRDRFEAEFARRQGGDAVRTLRDELASSGLRESDPDVYRSRAFALSVAGYFFDPRRANELTPFRVVGRIQRSVWDSLGDFDLLRPGGIDQIQCPAIVIHGRDDPIPLESSAEVARRLSASLMVLGACGHVPYVEQPELLFAVINAFLSATDRAGGPPLPATSPPPGR